jgi:hypothetical protein
MDGTSHNGVAPGFTPGTADYAAIATSQCSRSNIVDTISHDDQARSSGLGADRAG